MSLKDCDLPELFEPRIRAFFNNGKTVKQVIRIVRTNLKRNRTQKPSLKSAEKVVNLAIWSILKEIKYCREHHKNDN